MSRVLPLLFALYFCQGLPGGFVAQALPVILREQGLSLATIGWAGLLSAPWVLKILWAPLLDRFYLPSFGRRRSWLVPAQAGMIVCTIAFVFVHPEDSLVAVAGLFLLLNLFASTQDVAVDGWAVDLLEEDELGPGNAAQVAGFKVGNLVGGGVLLALIGVIGWSGDFVLMGTAIALTMAFVLVTPERPDGGRPQARAPGVLRRLWQAIRREGPVLWLFLVYAKFGESFGGAMVKPMLVDRGFSLATIGLVDGLYGSLATIAGAGLAGWIVRRRSWAFALGWFSLVQGLALVALAVYQAGPITVLGFGLVNACESFGGGGVAVAVFAFAMRRTNPDVGASQFTAAQVLYMSGAFLAGPPAGAVAQSLGYAASIGTGGALTLLLVLWVATGKAPSAAPRESA